MRFPILLLLIVFSFMDVCAQVQKKALALTPPMGWNSWNYFHCDVSEELIKQMADDMVSSGMKDAGYEYIVIDDCWQVSRDENDVIQADPERFPSGMKALADYVHSKGLKFGLYSDAGKKTCQERPGSLGYEAIDAKTYAEWGVDYLKYDWCHNGLRNTSKELYPIMAGELAALDHPIVYSMCNWGRQKPWKWAGQYAHLWRTTFDIKPRFKGKLRFFRSVMAITDKQQKIRQYNGPSGWNDADMLQVGNGNLTLDENRSHFTLWCMMAAPLMAGNDLRGMPVEIKQILTNPDAIAVNQDLLGISAESVQRKKGIQVFVKPLKDGAYAVCLLNRSNKAKTARYRFDKYLPSEKRFQVYNIWESREMGTSDSVYELEIPKHGVVFVTLR